MLITFDADMRALVTAQRLGFVATVTPEGRPSLSPKGTLRVWDDSHLGFCDVASPGTIANLRQNSWMEINVVDQLSRRGYRFLGRASLHRGDAIYRDAVARLAAEGGPPLKPGTVVLLAVERALPLESPAYAQTPDEWQLRARWSERRRALDAVFEDHLRRMGTWRAQFPSSRRS
jgi:predicted pyridoxine 5'-phosphate oxidase superfamily flavin-nucleotide-binding protein